MVMTMQQQHSLLLLHLPICLWLKCTICSTRVINCSDNEDNRPIVCVCVKNNLVFVSFGCIKLYQQLKMINGHYVMLFCTEFRPARRDGLQEMPEEGQDAAHAPPLGARAAARH
jgi:hypothetical protein